MCVCVWNVVRTFDWRGASNSVDLTTGLGRRMNNGIFAKTFFRILSAWEGVARPSPRRLVDRWRPDADSYSGRRKGRTWTDGRVVVAVGRSDGRVARLEPSRSVPILGIGSLSLRAARTRSVSFLAFWLASRRESHLLGRAQTYSVRTMRVRSLCILNNPESRQ